MPDFVTPGRGTRTRLSARPTERQFRILLPLGGGAAGLSRTRRDTEPLLRRGWVTAEWRPPYYQWVRITAEGLRALALAVERYGLPEFRNRRYHFEVCADCGRDWKPACKCGGRSYRLEEREVAA